MTTAIADLRQSLRSIARMPALAAVVVLSLGVGIGVNATIFSWAQALVLQPLPGVANASSVVLIEPRAETGSYPGTSWREYRDLRDRLPSFTDLFAARMAPFTITCRAAGSAPASGTGDDGCLPARRFGLLVSGNYFTALGLQPARGRLITPDDAAQPGAAPVVVVSYAYWHSQMTGADEAIGRTIRVNDRPVSVIGVTPDGFEGTSSGLTFDLWVPATMAPVLVAGSGELDVRGSRGYSAMGRLRQGVTVSQAQAEVDAVMRQLAREYPDTNAALTAEVLPFWNAPRGPRRFLIGALGVLQAVMLLLLAAICSNTATLLLARGAGRAREIGVRLALGASRGHIVRLLLTESLLLSLSGAALAVAFAVWGTEALRRDLIPLTRTLPIVFHTRVDGLGLLVIAALGLGSGLIFGLVPALHLARIRPQLSVRPGGNTATRSRLRDGVLAAQIGLAAIVLLVAGLFLKTFMDTQRTDPGFTRDGLLLAAYDLTGRNTGAADPRAFAAEILDRVRRLPSVDAAAISSSVPLDIHGLPLRLFTIEGRSREDGAMDQALANTVTPGYFEAMRIPILSGSDFPDLGDTARPPAVIVNEEFVRRFSADGEPIGRRIDTAGRTFTIAAVVRNSLYESFGEPPTPIVYFSYRDRPSAQGEIHIRTRADSELLAAAAVRRAVRELDAELPLFNVRTMTEHVEANLFMQRIPARMFAVLGPLILALAAVGIYAAVAYSAARRTAEIGVRLALGATPGRVVAEFVAGHLRVIGWGLVAGWLVVFVLAADVDVWVFSGVPLLLFAVAAMACAIPARRAARVDPLTALRSD